MRMIRISPNDVSSPSSIGCPTLMGKMGFFFLILLYIVGFFLLETAMIWRDHTEPKRVLNFEYRIF